MMPQDAREEPREWPERTVCWAVDRNWESAIRAGQGPTRGRNFSPDKPLSAWLTPRLGRYRR